MLKSMSTNKVKVRALQTEKGEMRYVFGSVEYMIRDKRLIALIQIVASRAADGVLGMIKSASIKNGRSLDLGQATVKS